MNLQQMDLEENLEMGLEDELSNLTADLLTLDINYPFLNRLFSVESGKWVDIESLCSDLNKIKAELAELKKYFQGTIIVTWLDYPEAQGYCTIIFFVPALLWNNLAVYNQQFFFEEFSKRS